MNLRLFTSTLLIVGTLCVLSNTSTALARGLQVNGQGGLSLVPRSSVTIRSQFDLFSYLEATTRSGSVLDWMTPQARARFLASLTFNQNGLTGFQYTDLRAELTATQIYQVLSLFGLQRITPLIAARIVTSEDRAIMQLRSRTLDYVDYWCSSPHTCTRMLGSICVVPGC